MSVGKPIPHDSARAHVTGSAAYIDDYVPRADELLVEFVGSPVACGRVLNIETSAARSLDGVVGVFTAADVKGQNHFGGIISDEPFLADEEVSYVGQPLVVIAAESMAAARKARSIVKIEFQPSEPVFTIDEAIAADSYLGPHRKIARGDFDEAFAAAPHQLTGRFFSGPQEQFYLESQAAIAYPDEQGRVVVHSSTQNTTETQAVVAEILGLGQHDVVCVCRRMGGAFGGKESQAAIPATMAALVAVETGRSARVVYSKDDDMCVTGKRHPYQTDYQAAFDDDGMLLAAKFDYYSNGGAFADLSTAVMERTLLHADNAYYVPNFEVNGRVCRTNFPPNTAFRGFGGPQGMAVMENLLQEIAIHLGLDATEVRRRNCYGKSDRNTTHYEQLLGDHHLPEIFDELITTSDYSKRLQQVEQFNQSSCTHLRGISLTPMKFGISFTTKFLNQGNALVNVYTDGTVQVSTGATEMGQGVNTKIRQVVADEFGLPVESVRVMDTSTEKNNNTSPTAASAGTDLNGAAAVEACRKIRANMVVYAAELLADPDTGQAADKGEIRFVDGHVLDRRHPEKRIPFGEFVSSARRERVNMGARGFYATPGIDFDRDTGRGNPFFYFTTGCAVSEVLVDRFTGETSVERIDLLMDVGQQINPGIDRGQVIGGFVQGMGYVTNECVKYDAEGRLLAHSPTTYKIPHVTDVPREFHVNFVENHSNHRNIRASKAVGEPPFMLALSVWTAIKHAISQAKPGSVPNLRIPATGEEILRSLTELTSTNSAAASTKGAPNARIRTP